MKHDPDRTLPAVDPANGSVSVDQADALQAGAELLRLFNGRADAYVTSHPSHFHPAKLTHWSCPPRTPAALQRRTHPAWTGFSWQWPC